MKLTTLYEDEHIICIDKPAGLLSVPDRFDATKANLANLLKQRIPTLHVVHRLDRDTSGVIIFAKNAEAHAALSQDFEGRDVEKYYLALVNGTPPESGIIDAPIVESLSKPGTMIVTKKGKESKTAYTLIQGYELFSLVEVQIFTGRMHQIRVHMAYEGYPLFIDPVYGTREAFFLSEIKGRRYKISKDEEEEQPMVARQTLHAAKLTFNHPATQKSMTIESPMPKDFRALINQVGKYYR